MFEWKIIIFSMVVRVEFNGFSKEDFEVEITIDGKHLPTARKTPAGEARRPG